MKDTLNAVVKGFTCDGDPFTETLTFHLVKSESEYGTGFYMSVKMSLTGKKWIDVRYEKTTDINVLAARFIENWYGENAREVTTE